MTNIIFDLEGFSLSDMRLNGKSDTIAFHLQNDVTANYYLVSPGLEKLFMMLTFKAHNNQCYKRLPNNSTKGALNFLSASVVA